MSNFESKLSALVAQEMAAACDDNDPDRAGVAIEQLLRNTALAIAMACRGDASGISDMLEGGTQYLFESAAGFAKIGVAIGMGATKTSPVEIAKGLLIQPRTEKPR